MLYKTRYEIATLATYSNKIYIMQLEEMRFNTLIIRVFSFFLFIF